ncbi:MAG: hypothetical protein MK171_03595 [Pirellulales bacterium]|nr:hypothetical protein [Pirellulales bacterium]
MLKDRQDIVAVGELAAFALAWMLCIYATLGDHRARTTTGNAVAESSSHSDQSQDHPPTRAPAAIDGRPSMR